ncbi:MAG: nuclear transport factor 2 family protein [Psychroserpens sp.]|uniref:nuclear transport factor 2 family protein n=1 Tax=Psychroserpens sp. TaxID=2020870 RepID=UPI003002AABF
MKLKWSVLNFTLLLITSITAFGQSNETQKYYRHLSYNHVSPYIEFIGTHQIDKATAQNTSHYVFKENEKGQLIEILNNHYHTERVHPLASIGAYKTVIDYNDNREIRTFYDPNGKRILNDRAVYKEVYYFDSKQFKDKLEFFDLKDQPMESNWKIAQYQWSKKKKLIIEKRFNLKGELVNISPYFAFGITGIKLNKNGTPKAHYNLDENLKVKNNAIGVALYQDTFDANGNHVKFSYHDKANALVMNQWNYAIGEKIYDDTGNQIGLKRYDETNALLTDFQTPSNVKTTMSAIASAKDSLAIKNRALGYLIGLQKLDPKLMGEVLNDSLNKVTIGYDRQTKKEYANRTTHAQMIAFANSWNKANNKFPFNPNNQVIILDIYNRIANVKLVSDNWVEYLHLIKLDGNWQIINLIWQHKDIGRYPKD